MEAVCEEGEWVAPVETGGRDPGCDVHYRVVQISVSKPWLALGTCTPHFELAFLLGYS